MRIAAVEPGSADARRLLGDYVGELAGLLPGGYDARPEWDPEPYGAPRARVLVAYDGDDPIACAGLREHAREAGELKHFYVAPRARRRGVGAALVAAVEDEARNLGYRRVVLDTAAPLEDAARLYERSGYRAVAAFNDNRHAAKWYEKLLPLDDRALWGAFVRSSLPAGEWSHATHLRVAYLHVTRFELDEAHLRMRVGIIRLNAAHGLVESTERGYHETLTRAWLALVAAAARARPANGSESFLEAHRLDLHKTALLRHYSRETLLSVRARAVFVPPDRARLP